MEEEREHFIAINYPPRFTHHTCTGTEEISFE